MDVDEKILREEDKHLVVNGLSSSLVICETVEDYLMRSEYLYRKVEDNVWIVEDDLEDVSNIVVCVMEPLLVFRVKLMSIAKISSSMERESLFRTLLEFNLTNLTHGAYALEDENIVIVDTLQIDNLDFNEFRASLDSIALAIRADYEKLSKYCNVD